MAEFDFAPLEPPAAVDPRDARALLDTAHAEAELVRETARAAGHAEGRDAALAAVAPALEALDQALAATRQRGEGTADRLESEAVDLAFAVAEKILAASVELDRSIVLETVRGALRGLVERERVTVLVNPDDLELVRAAAADLQAGLGGIEHCEIQSERRVGVGGAVVRYTEGEIDATMLTKLERAREVVAEHLSQRR